MVRRRKLLECVKTKTTSAQQTADPIYLAANAIHNLLLLLPARTDDFLGLVLIVMLTGHLVAMRGSLARAVAQLLGHKDLRMAARYQHLSPGFFGEAVGRLDGVLGEFRSPDATNKKALTEGEPISALDS